MTEPVLTAAGTYPSLLDRPMDVRRSTRRGATPSYSGSEEGSRGGRGFPAVYSRFWLKNILNGHSNNSMDGITY